MIDGGLPYDDIIQKKDILIDYLTNEKYRLEDQIKQITHTYNNKEYTGDGLSKSSRTTTGTSYLQILLSCVVCIVIGYISAYII